MVSERSLTLTSITLRLFGLQIKVAPAEGDTINGRYIPGGTKMGVFYPSMCRRKDIFGQDSDVYRPERWIEADEEQRKLYQKSVESVFGTGRFQCLGKHIAVMELHKTLAEVSRYSVHLKSTPQLTVSGVKLVKRFDWSIVDPIRGVQTRSDALHIHREMNVVARPR